MLDSVTAIAKLDRETSPANDPLAIQSRDLGSVSNNLRTTARDTDPVGTPFDRFYTPAHHCFVSRMVGEANNTMVWSVARLAQFGAFASGNPVLSRGVSAGSFDLQAGTVTFRSDAEANVWVDAFVAAQESGVRAEGQTLYAADGSAFKIVIDTTPRYDIDTVAVNSTCGSSGDMRALVDRMREGTLDQIANRSTNYSLGSAEVVEHITGLAKSGGTLTVAVVELAELTKVNSLDGGHQLGNVLVRSGNHAVKDLVKELLPTGVAEPFVFRGPNGSVMIALEGLTPEQIRDHAADFEAAICKEFPADLNLPGRGIVGKVRVGATAISPQPEHVERDYATALYFEALREAGGAAEWMKRQGGEESGGAVFSQVLYSTLVSSDTPVDREKFLHTYHNYVPPEAQEGTLFVLHDQIVRVSEILERSRHGYSGTFYPDVTDLIASGHSNARGYSELVQESKILLAMLKRPTRFEGNVREVFNGNEIPILNYKAAENLQRELITQGVPFFRADGDLDHLRDLFRTHKVSGPDSLYADFYIEAARELRQLEQRFKETRNGRELRVFMEKQSSSDEYALIMVGATADEVPEILDVARKAMEAVGRRVEFDKINKVTGNELGFGGVTTTLGCDLTPICSEEDLKVVRVENDRAINLRKYIPGKNTCGGRGDISRDEGLGILNTLGSYLDIPSTVPLARRSAAHREVSEALHINRGELVRAVGEEPVARLEARVRA